MSLSNRLRPLARMARVYASAALLIVGAASLSGQGTKVLDATALHPPRGAAVAIVEFSDMECPACARANPVLKEASAKYKIPWVRHDYLIPAHPWSKSAAVYARWFDTQGNGLGDAYRDAVFANQQAIYNVSVLERFTQSFAGSRKVAMPFAIDPQNKFGAMVQADDAVGKRTGVAHTPTIFIVISSAKGDHYVEVEDTDRDLYRTIDQAMAETKGALARK